MDYEIDEELYHIVRPLVHALHSRGYYKVKYLRTFGYATANSCSPEEYAAHARREPPTRVYDVYSEGAMHNEMCVDLAFTEDRDLAYAHVQLKQIDLNTLVTPQFWDFEPDFSELRPRDIWYQYQKPFFALGKVPGAPLGPSWFAEGSSWGSSAVGWIVIEGPKLAPFVCGEWLIEPQKVAFSTVDDTPKMTLMAPPPISLVPAVLCAIQKLNPLEQIWYTAQELGMTEGKNNPWEKHEGVVVAEAEPGRAMISAQRFRIFESRVKRLAGVPYDAPWRKGRLTLALALWHRGRKEEVLEALRYAFSAGTSVQARTGFLVPGTQKETGRARAHAAERLTRSPEEQFESRQSYEEMLALGRDLYYRVVHEQGRYTVWPWAPGPRVFTSRSAAVRRALELSHTADPRK